LSRAAPLPIDGPEAGFTIIEVLIALAVVAVSIVAIASVMSTNARGVQSLGQHVALMQSVRSVMAQDMPPRAELQPGELSGQRNDHRWQIDISPLGGSWVVPDADVAWIPQLVKIRVQSSSGAAFDLQTIRLMRRPRQ
jgi:general secretion pathway protein I